jgi:hypothetical protein
MAVAHNNGWIVARMMHLVPKDAPTPDGMAVEYVLFSEGEQLEWTLRESGYFPRDLYVADDGTVIADRGYADNDAAKPRPDGLLIHTDGQPADLDGWWPVGEPVGGAVPVCGETSCGWLDLASGLPGPSHDRPDWSHFWGDRWFYRDATRPTTIVAEGPGDQSTIEIAGAPASIRPFALRQRWLLLADDVEDPGIALETGTTLWRVDLQTGTVATHTLSIPEGLAWIDSSYCNSTRVGLTVDGDLMLVLRDSELARIHHVDFETGESMTLGQPLSQILAARPFSVTQTTTVIGAASGDDTFCIIPEWEPTDDPDVVLGSSLQLLVGDELHWLPDNHALYSYHQKFGIWFERSGRCVAYRTEEGIEIFDIETEERTTIDCDAGGWLDPLL